MKTFIIALVILVGVFAYGFKVGKMTAEKENKDKVVQTTTKSKYDTEKLNKELQELRKKVREAKGEECNYVLSYPVRECLHD